jgi:hypothetical protein
VVWVGLDRDDPALVLPGSLVFLFFALALWPFWMPFSAACLERVRNRRRHWWGVTAASVGWGIFLYLPILLEPERHLSVAVVHHSIHYDYTAVPLVQLVSPLPLRILYLATCAVPLLGCSDARVRWFGGLLLASALLAQVVFQHAFASVWCFFAAALALYLCWAIPSSSPAGPVRAAEGVPPGR